MAEKDYVIVGLGNPGKKYELTRHNMGYLVVQGLARKMGLVLRDDRTMCAFTAKGQSGDATLHLLLPTTYMNDSGRAVRRYLDYYKLTPAGLVVVVDDIALPFGEMRIRERGSAGGHNGLKSIESHVGTHHYVRLRMGIGDHRQSDEPSEASATLIDYVLGNFTSQERSKLEEFIDGGTQVLMRIASEPIARVMNAVNTKRKEDKPRDAGQQENKHDPEKSENTKPV